MSSPSITCAIDYITHVKRCFFSKLPIVNFETIYEKAAENAGQYRYRLRLANGDFLAMSERFTIEGGKINVTKYSFHWQDGTGQLRKRWDNAPHHAELSTFPHHLHNGTEEMVLPHPPMTALEVLKIIEDN